MHDPRNILLGRLAVEEGRLDRQTAFACLEEAGRSGRSILDVAVGRGLMASAVARDLAQRARGAPDSGAMVGPVASVTPGSAPGGSSRPPGSGGRPGARPEPGELIDGYELKALLGEGGMGAVFRAEQAGAEFAIKLITSDNPTALERFSREARALAEVDRHPGVCRIHRFAEHEGRPYVLLELVEGHDLQQELDAGKPLELQRAVRILEAISSALAHCHRHGITHRDLKPANILIRESDDQPVVTDFGLALVVDTETLTRTGETVGTPLYMAPEQVRAERERIGPATDVWALGALGFQMLTGRTPFEGATAIEIAMRIQASDPEPVSKLNRAVDADLTAIIAHCFQKDPAQRYSHAGALLADLEAWRTGRPVTGHRSSLASRVGRRLVLRVGRTGAWILGLTALLLLGGPAVWWLVAHESEAVRVRREQLDGQVKAARAELDQAFLGLGSLIALQLRALAEPELGERLADQPLIQRAEAAGRAWRELVEAIETTRAGPLSRAAAGALEGKQGRRLRVQAEALAALEAIRRGDPLPASSGALPDALTKILQATAALKAGELKLADRGFRAVARRPGRFSSTARFGEAVVALRRKDWSAAAAQLSALENDEALGPPAAALQRTAIEQSALAVALSADADVDELRSRLVALAKFYERRTGDPGAGWARFNERLQARFSKTEADAFEADMVRLAKAYNRLEEVERSKVFPLVVPTIGKPVRVALARLADADGQLPIALYHYYEIRRIDPEFEIPEGFEASDVIGILLRGMFDPTVKSRLENMDPIEGIYLVLLAASRAQTLLPLMQEQWLSLLDEQGALDKQVEKSPDDPYPRFWRGLVRLKNVRKQDIPGRHARRLEDLMHVLKHKRTPPHFRAYAATHYVQFDVSFVRDSGGDVNARAPHWKQILDDYADPRAHPEPDDIWMVYVLSQRTVAEPDVLLKWCDKALATLTARHKASLNKTLGEGRPAVAPMNPVLADSYKERIGEILSQKLPILVAEQRWPAILAVTEAWRTLDHHDVYMRLARPQALALDALGRRDEAREWIERLLKRYPDFHKFGELNRLRTAWKREEKRARKNAARQERQAGPDRPPAKEEGESSGE